MAKAVAGLEERGEPVTARAVAAAARISLNTACTWRRPRETGAMEPTATLSVLHYTSHSVSDTMPATENSAELEIAECEPAAVDPPTAAPALESKPLMPALRRACPAVSHQLLWRWSAGSWQCPSCGG